MRCTFLLVAVGLLVFSLMTLAYITQQSNEPVLTAVGDTSLVVLALLAMLGCWCTYRKIDNNFPCEKRGWLLATIAFLLFAFGDIYWEYAEIFLKVEVPIGSIADWSWQIAYLTLFIGIFYFMRNTWHSKNMVYGIMMPAFAVAVSFAIYHLLRHVIYVHQKIIHLIQDSYVFYDIILLGMITVMLLPLIQSHNRLMNFWLLFGFAFALRIIFDFLFASLTAINAYATGNFIDLLYAGSYLLIIFSTDAKLKMLQRGTDAKTAVKAK